MASAVGATSVPGHAGDAQRGRTATPGCARRRRADRAVRRRLPTIVRRCAAARQHPMTRRRRQGSVICLVAAASTVAATWSASSGEDPMTRSLAFLFYFGSSEAARQHPEVVAGDRLSENDWPCTKTSSAPRVLNRLAPISPLITTTVSHLPVTRVTGLA